MRKRKSAVKAKARGNAINDVLEDAIKQIKNSQTQSERDNDPWADFKSRNHLPLALLADQQSRRPEQSDRDAVQRESGCGDSEKHASQNTFERTAEEWKSDVLERGIDSSLEGKECGDTGSRDDSERRDDIGLPKGDEEGDVLAAMRTENRNFVTILLGGLPYIALLNLGATLSLIGPRVVERYEDRLEPSDILIKAATGKISKTLGVLNVKIEIDRIVKSVDFKGVPELGHDIILGMDFCLNFSVDLRWAQGCGE